jgi:hypothetical protein
VCSLLAIPILLPPANPPDDLQLAIENAIDFFEESREPYALLMLDVAHRRFGMAEFADALQRYDQELVKRPLDEISIRVFRRIADHDNPLQEGDFESMLTTIDYITVVALYCDRFGLPEDYPETLIEAVDNGEYMLTHVLLALIWIQNNDCEMPISNGFIEEVYNDSAALIDDDLVVTDLELEAAAFLYLAGHGSLVDDAFIGRVIAVQNDDGGWKASSDEPVASDWHASILGLLILLHAKHPADSYPSMLAPA